MIYLDPQLSDEDASQGLDRLLQRLGGEWDIEHAHRSWRAEQVVEGLERRIGLSWCEQGEQADTWLLSWDARHDVPDDAALGAMVAGLVTATGILVVGWAVGLAPWAFVGGPLGGAWVFRTLANRIRASLPDVVLATEELATRIDGVWGEVFHPSSSVSGADGP